MTTNESGESSTRRTSRDERSRQYMSWSKAALIRMYTRGFHREDGSGFVQGLTPEKEVAKWRKEEIISSLVTMEFGA